MKRLNGQRRIALILGALLIWGLPSLASGASLDLRISPDVVEIGAFFNGRRVTVTGQIPGGAEAVMEIMGQPTAEHLMRKGRRGGLWMNVGELVVQGAPSLYMVMSTDPKLITAPPPETTWGYRALEKRITFSGSVAQGERGKFLEQFLELKESGQIYAAFPGKIKVKSASTDPKKIQGTFPLPITIKAGTYNVCLSVIQNGTLLARQCADLKVAMVGFPAMLASLAYQHGATYGILAVIIAIVTGFAMGFLFKGGGGH